MKFSTYFFSFIICAYSLSLHATITPELQHHGATRTQIDLTFDLEPGERLYQETIVISADQPEINLSPWQAGRELQQWPGKRNASPRHGWQGPVTITITAQRHSANVSTDAHLHVSYATSRHPYPQEQIFPLSFATSQATSTIQKQPAPTSMHQRPPSKKKKKSWAALSSYIKGLVKSTQSPWIRILLVFLLGLLMSLTPCIYPMIPITIGILQSQSSHSVGGNTLRAVFYTLGMGTTYAIFGLLASCTGPLCGYLFSNPLFVFFLAGLLMYFGLCMFGVFEMYIPRFLQKERSHKGGSLWTVFVFGIASGTLASPCVSPGLALVLSIVATLGNSVLGFIMLFAFGVGLSMPLLIVGLFSGSMHVLPRAGLWMIEVKKLFGFLLFGLSFYYLSSVVPHYLLLWFIGLFLASSGLYYIYSSYHAQTPLWKKIHTLFGMALIAASVATFVNAWQATFLEEPVTQVRNIWLSDYTQARELALKENKLLFIDVWADFCSICITINKTLLSEPEVMAILEQQFVPFKVNGTKPASEPYATIHKEFTITGFPTYLIVDPRDNKVIKRWGSKLYNVDKMVLVDKLRAL